MQWMILIITVCFTFSNTTPDLPVWSQELWDSGHCRSHSFFDSSVCCSPLCVRHKGPWKIVLIKVHSIVMDHLILKILSPTKAKNKHSHFQLLYTSVSLPKVTLYGSRFNRSLSSIPFWGFCLKNYQVYCLCQKLPYPVFIIYSSALI